MGESFSNYHCKVFKNKRPNPTHGLIHGRRRTQARKVQPQSDVGFLSDGGPCSVGNNFTIESGTTAVLFALLLAIISHPNTPKL